MSSLSKSGQHPAMTGVSALLKAVIAAVKLVSAKEIMPRYMKVAHLHKDDGSLCTEADLEAQAALTKKLKSILNVPVLGEEMTAAEQQKAWEEAGQSGLWCVDPIDGTSNFARGLPYFAVSVALLRDHKSVLGVVYDPVADEMFAAERDRGVFLNGQTLTARESIGELSQALAAVDFKRLKKELLTRLVTSTPYTSQRNFGASALDWCYVAAGRYDLYLHGGQKLWDYAAGSLILTESGGYACSIEGEKFSQCDIGVRSAIVARNKKLFDEWKAWVCAQ